MFGLHSKLCKIKKKKDVGRLKFFEVNIISHFFLQWHQYKLVNNQAHAHTRDIIYCGNNQNYYYHSSVVSAYDNIIKDLAQQGIKQVQIRSITQQGYK